MPPNSVWDLLNYLPGLGAPLRERGPFIDGSGVLNNYVQAGVWCAFAPTSGPNRVNVAITETGTVYKVTDGGVATSSGTLGYTALDQPPVFMGGVAASAATAVYTGLVIVPQGSSAAPQKFDGTSLTALNGSPPRTLFAGVYKDYLLLGNGTLSGGGTEYPNRVWFSPPGDPDCAVSGSVTAWDTTDSWVDFNDSVFGFGSTPNALIVFHRTGISRVRGNVAPPETDFVIDHHWHKTDLLSPFSIVEDGGYVYWCSTDGVFRTDGVSVEDLTLKGGMLRYWKDMVAGSVAPSSWRVSAGLTRGHLFIQVLEPGRAAGALGTNSEFSVDGFIVNLNEHSWARLNNFQATCFWSGQVSQADELFFGSKKDPTSGVYNSRKRVFRASPVFIPTNTDHSDGTDSDYVASEATYSSILETAFFDLGRPGLKRMKRGFFGYDLKRVVNSASVSAEVGYLTEPSDLAVAGDYTSIGNLAETSAVTGTTIGAYARKALALNTRASGVALRISRTASNGDLSIHDLGLEVHFQEESKRE